MIHLLVVMQNILAIAKFNVTLIRWPGNYNYVNSKLLYLIAGGFLYVATQEAAMDGELFIA